jgi:hypothetical protein
MIELLSLIFGFGSSTIPYIFKYFQDAKDKAHEIIMTQMAMQNNKDAGNLKLAEIEMTNDAQELAIAHNDEFRGTAITSAMNAAVPAVYAYTFLLIFFMVQVIYYILLKDTPPAVFSDLMWTEADQSLMNIIMSHYFGNHAMKRLLGH